MTDAQVIGFSIFLPILVLWVAVIARASADKHRPTDWTAERHRKIAHNGFKSRMGVR